MKTQFWERDHNKKVVASMRRDEELKIKEKLQKELQDDLDEKARQA